MLALIPSTLRRLRHRLAHLLGWPGGDIHSRWADDGSGNLIMFWRCRTCGVEKGHYALPSGELTADRLDPSEDPEDGQ